MSKILSADMKFAPYLKTATVELPEYECSVILRQLNAGQSLKLDKENPQFLVRYVGSMIVDESGNRIFVTDADIANLADMKPTAFQRLLDAANELNGGSQDAVEATTKNSETSLSEVSASV